MTFNRRVNDMRLPYSTRLVIKDHVSGFFKGSLKLQKRLRAHLRDQNLAWDKSYTQGYFYQGLEEIGINGAKPTGYRFKQYDVHSIIKDADVLDIGSNSGFVSCYCAMNGARSVTGIELNPYQNRIALETRDFLRLRNVDIVEGDFSEFLSEQKFDVILSFSNHHTIDGNLDMGFEKYIEKIVDLLKPGGHLLFESHNVFAAGEGGVGDDGDMEIKVSIMNKHFDILRYRMVKCYLKHAVEDLDKLFIVAQKSDSPEPIKFSLPQAINKYHY